MVLLLYKQTNGNESNNFDIYSLFDNEDSLIKKWNHNNNHLYILSIWITFVFFSFIYMYIINHIEEFSEDNFYKFKIKNN